MAQDKKKQTQQTMTDPMLEGTGQPGELANTPVVQSDMQDPALIGTGQPGELSGTPTVADPGFVQEVQTQKAQSDSLFEAKIKEAKRQASMEVAQKFSLFDIAEDLGLEFKPFKKGGK